MLKTIQKVSKRDGNKQSVAFLDEKGELVEGRRKAMERLAGSSKQVISKFESLMKMFTAKSRAEDYEWDSSDPTIPTGWKSRHSGQRTIFLSPEGEKFFSRSNIIEHMVRKCYDISIIEETRLSAIAYEGWKQNELLPEGWLFKHERSEDSHSKMFFLASTGELLKSFISAVK